VSKAVGRMKLEQSDAVFEGRKEKTSAALFSFVVNYWKINHL
jgi:hypothetical protein